MFCPNYRKFIILIVQKAFVIPDKHQGLYLFQSFQNYADNDNKAGSAEGNVRPEDTVEYKRQYADNGKTACADENNVVQDSVQIITGRLTRSDTGDKTALLFHIVRNLKGIEGNRCIEVGEEDHHYNIHDQSDGVYQFTGLAPVAGIQAAQDISPRTCSFVSGQLRNDDRNLQNRLREDNRDNTCGVYL